MKHSFALIALLLCATVVVMGYAMLPRESTLVSALGLRQLPMGATVSADKALDEPAEVTSVDSVAATAAQENAVDTTTQNVLLVGDSMNERLRQSVAAYCNANGHKLTSVVWYSSSTETWAKSKALQHYIRTIKPTHIFICLGGNELFVRDLDNRENYIRMIKQQCGKVPTIWIGPPNWKKDTGINALIEKHFGKRAYYPSLKLKLERASDKHHVNQRGCDVWMDSIAAWMNRGQSIHPFRLEKPQPSKKNTAHKRLVLMPDDKGPK